MRPRCLVQRVHFPARRAVKRHLVVPALVNGGVQLHRHLHADGALRPHVRELRHAEHLRRRVRRHVLLHLQRAFREARHRAVAYVVVVPSRYAVQFIKWFTYSDDTIDGKSRTKAYALFEIGLLASLEPGSVKCLQQIHAYLFGGLYDFAGQIRDKNISKGGFQFANAYYFSTILPNIENMPETTFDEIINKYVEMNVAHPFMEGNGRSTRIWLDLMLKRTLKKCIDWSKVNKNAYLEAMRKSVTDSSDLKALLEPALTRKINDREMFMKGIDYSYYYESDDPTLEPDQKEV